MKFREFVTSSGKKVLGGKSAEQNEELVKQFIGEKNFILHTKEAGSPFCVVDDLKPTKKDLKETAIFCASRSKDWRDNQGDVVVHIFSGKDVYKEKKMKTGMFGVKKVKNILVKRVEIEKIISKKS